MSLRLMIEKQVFDQLPAYISDFPSLQMILKMDEEEALKDIRIIMNEYPAVNPIAAIIAVTEVVEKFENYILYGRSKHHADFHLQDPEGRWN